MNALVCCLLYLTEVNTVDNFPAGFEEFQIFERLELEQRSQNVINTLTINGQQQEPNTIVFCIGNYHFFFHHKINYSWDH